MKNQVVVLVFCLLVMNSSSQNLEKIGSDDMLQIHGALNFNTVNYFISGADARRDPFTWFANGTLNFSLLDVAVPLTYSYSNLGGKFTQPFNQFGLHPTYKWIKTHIGYHSMNFSNYTVAGHLFNGGALELSPGKWNFQIMGGRLNKSIAYDAIVDNLNEIVFTRLGFGMKGGYKSGFNEVNAILFKAYDINSSLSFIPIGSEIKPMDNLVGSLSAKTLVVKKIGIEGEFACSGLTGNLRNENNDVESNDHLFSKLFKVNETTQYYYAYKIALSYKMINSNISFNYEHIDPGYRTLGGYFFNNDLENYTLAFNSSMFKNKINLGFNFGYQFNNLSNQKAATTKRVVGSMNVAANFHKNITLSGSYSNFSNFTKNRLQTDPYYSNLGDTLNFYNQTQNGSINSLFRLGKKSLSSFQMMFNFNQCINVTGNFSSVGIYGMGAPEGSPVNVYTGNLLYGLQIRSIHLNLSSGINTNQTVSDGFNSTYIGPMSNISKTFGKKITLNTGLIYNRQYSNNLLQSNIFNCKLGLSYKLKFGEVFKSNLNFSCNANWLIKNPIDETMKKINEINIFTNLSYAF